MLSIVIVEDEYRICRMLKRMIESAGADFQVAGIATDGVTGVSLIQSCKPDVVITDIKMGGCSGIDMIAEVRPQNPEIDFIIISGYRYFDNAYRAIQMGIKHYLLKPIEEEELIAILKSIQAQRSSKDLESKDRKKLQSQISAQQNYLREDFIFELYHKKFSFPLTIAFVNEYKHCRFQEGIFQCIIMKLDCCCPAEPGEQRLLFQNLIRIIEKVYVPYIFEIVCGVQSSFLICVLNYAPEYAEKIEGELLSCCFEDAKLQLQKFGPYALVIGVGTQKDSISAVPDSLTEARLALRNRLTKGSMRIIRYYESPQCGSIVNLLESSLKASLLNCIKTNDVQGLKQWIPTAKKTFDDALRIDISSLFNLCVYISKLINVFIWDNLNLDTQEQVEALELALESADSIESMLSFLENYFLDMAAFYSEHTERNEPAIIQEVKEFIHSHYVSPLKLEDVATAVHLSPTYLSSLFKQTAGVNFIDYLTQVRIDAAKNLLRTTENSIPRIAQACGYNDEKYFSQLFRRVVGLRPTAYRKLYK